MDSTTTNVDCASANAGGDTPVRALEPNYYFDPDIYAQELEKIFYRTWQCICHTSEIPEPGCYVVRRIADQEIAVVRQKDGTVKAFYNVCMHRAHPLLRGTGRCKVVMTCPYHRWSYDLNGGLQGAPFSEDVPGFERKAVSLTEVRFELFCGFVFVNLDDSAPTIGSQTAEIEQEIKELVPGIETYRFVDEVALEHPCNWKVTVENYAECYHCRGVHGNALFEKLAIETYSLRVHGTTATHVCEPKPEYCSGDGRNPLLENDAFASWYIWPTFSLNRQPGGFLRIGLFEPIAIDRTVYRYRYFSNGTLPDEEVSAYMRRHAELTGGEDADLVARVQKGLQSRGYKPGILIADGTNHGEREHGVYQFQSLVRQTLSQ